MTIGVGLASAFMSHECQRRCTGTYFDPLLSRSASRLNTAGFPFKPSMLMLGRTWRFSVATSSLSFSPWCSFRSSTPISSGLSGGEARMVDDEKEDGEEQVRSSGSEIKGGGGARSSLS